MNFCGLFFALTTFVCVFRQIDSLDVEGINCKTLQRRLKIREISDIYLPHEEECNSFYRCSLGGAAKRPCGVDTIFSLRNKDCRRPEDAKCISLNRFLEKKNIKLEDFYVEDYPD